MSEDKSTNTTNVVISHHVQAHDPPTRRTWMSITIGALVEALARAQAEMKPALKDAVNPHFKTNYADLASVWDACRSALSSQGIAVVQLPWTAPDGLLFVTTVLSHKSGEWIRSDLGVKPEKPGAQAMGSAITYLRRYALSAMVGVAPEDDDAEAAEGRNGSAPPRRAATSTPPPKPSAPTAPAAEYKPSAEALRLDNEISASMSQAELDKVAMQVGDAKGAGSISNADSDWLRAKWLERAAAVG